MILSWTSWLSQIASEKQSENLSAFRISCTTLKLIQTTTLFHDIWCEIRQSVSAFTRLEAFLFCLKKWWYKDEIDWDRSGEAEDVLTHLDFAVIFEAVLESAPQFIIQLYAISVQQEPAAITQIITLPISFLTQAWDFTVIDRSSLDELEILSGSSDLNVKHQLALYVTHLLFLSSRVFITICYFTVSYKWWVIDVLMFHSCAVAIATIIQIREEVDSDASHVFLIFMFMDIHCL